MRARAAKAILSTTRKRALAIFGSSPKLADAQEQMAPATAPSLELTATGSKVALRPVARASPPRPAAAAPPPHHPTAPPDSPHSPPLRKARGVYGALATDESAGARNRSADDVSVQHKARPWLGVAFAVTALFGFAATWYGTSPPPACVSLSHSVKVYQTGKAGMEGSEGLTLLPPDTVQAYESDGRCTIPGSDEGAEGSAAVEGWWWDKSGSSTVAVDTTQVYQEILGFGGAFTEAAAINFAKLPSEAQVCESGPGTFSTSADSFIHRHHHLPPPTTTTFRRRRRRRPSPPRHRRRHHHPPPPPGRIHRGVLRQERHRLHDGPHPDQFVRLLTRVVQF